MNVRAPYLLTQSLLPLIIASHGQVVFVNSTAGLHARKGAGQYAATKHALRGLADSLREDVNERGVRVLSVFLGRTASRMEAAVFEREGRPYTPGNLLQPEDVASVIVHALGPPRSAEVTDIVTVQGVLRRFSNDATGWRRRCAAMAAVRYTSALSC